VIIDSISFLILDFFFFWYFVVESLTEEQYVRIRNDAFPRLFKFEMNTADNKNSNSTEMNSCQSFLLCFYQDIYLKLKQRLKIDIPIIDYNFLRLLNCISKVILQRSQQQKTLNLNELAIALEFYLQIDGKLIFFFRKQIFLFVYSRHVFSQNM